MSVTSGFFNSLNHDRRYSAQQFSALFDGIINDGVFANIGVAFAIKADTGVTINIGKGKAWFNSAWVYNDALLPKTLEGSEVVLDRIDAVVIEVDHSDAVRLGDIKIVKGTPSSNPQRPAMASTETKHQYPLAYIYRKAGSTAITQADITNMVGTSSCPYITGILQVQNIDNIVAQWEAQWNLWYAEQVSEAGSSASELMAEMQSQFDIWFADVKALLEDDVATELAGKVAELQGKFDDLAREGAVYDTLEDDDLDIILGSDGTPINGKTVLGGNTGGGPTGPVDAATLQGKTPADFRPADWVPSAEEVGAAPAGIVVKRYNLSTSAAFTDALNDLWNNTPDDGERHVVFNVTASDAPLYGGVWTVIAYKINNDYGVVQAISYNGSAPSVLYIRKATAWGAWEWENPPMANGVEYRTTERFQNYPVYVKSLAIGGISKGDNAIEHKTSVYHPISVDIMNNDQEWMNNSSLFTDISLNRTYLYLNCTSNFGYIRAIIKYTRSA